VRSGEIDHRKTHNDGHPPIVNGLGEELAQREGVDQSRMAVSRVVGALFLVGFLTYGIGTGIATSLVGSTNFLPTIGASQYLLITGAFLMFLVTGVDVGKAVLLFPVVEKHSKRTALAYFAAMIIEVVLLGIGALALLLIVPLAKHAGEAGTQTLASVLAQTNGTAYQMGEMTLGVGATFLCWLLLRSGLVPRWLAISGLIGYPALAAGTVAEIFGIHIGLYLTIPGFFFELVFPAWLIFRGFNAAAYRGPVRASGS
jgi:hypothetical protein